MFNYYLDAFRYNYANFSGRARRSEYWYFTLFNFIVVITLILIGGGFLAASEQSGTGMIIYFIYYIASFLPGLALTVRRLHDVGKSGWFIFISIIPIVGLIWLLVLFCTEGDQGPNAYGDDPKNPGGYNEVSEDEIGSIGENLG